MCTHRFALLLLLGVVGFCQGMSNTTKKNDENDENKKLLVYEEKKFGSFLDMHNEKMERIKSEKKQKIDKDDYLLHIAKCYTKVGEKGDFEYLSPQGFDENKALKKYPTLVNYLHLEKNTCDKIDVELLSSTILKKLLIEITKGPYLKSNDDFKNKHYCTFSKFEIVFEDQYSQDKEYAEKKDIEFISFLAEILELQSKEKRLRKIVEKDLRETFAPCYLQLHSELKYKLISRENLSYLLASLIQLRKKAAKSECIIN